MPRELVFALLCLSGTALRTPVLHRGQLSLEPRRHPTGPLTSTSRKAGFLSQRPSESPLKVLTGSRASLVLKQSLSVALLCGLNGVSSKILHFAGVTFPPALFAMLALASTLVIGRAILPSATNQALAALTPGGELLAQWLPVFFAPSMIMLPMASLPDLTTAVRLLGLLVGGFVVTLVGTAHASALASRFGAARGSLKTRLVVPSQLSKGPFSLELLRTLSISTGVLAAASVVLPGLSWTRVGALAQGAALGAATLASYVGGVLMPRRVKTWIHPLVTTMAAVTGVAVLLGAATGVGYAGIMNTYVNPSGWGPGNLLLAALTPSVVSFALPLYARRLAIANSLPVVATGVSVSTMLGVFGTAAAAKLFNVGNEAQRLAVLTRSITTPLAMTAASSIGADVSLAVACVVVTGLLGAAAGPKVMDGFKVPRDPRARGLAMGGAAHGLGTAALAGPGGDQEAAAFSAINMGLCGSLTTILLVIPQVQTLLRAMLF